jgi:predicted alpha-1,6-mannanase (GH76 family)
MPKITRPWCARKAALIAASAAALAAGLAASPAPASAASAPHIGPIVSGVSPKLCADVYQQSMANGAKIDVYTCNGGANQRFTVESDGTIQVLGKCMDITNRGTASGTPVQLWACNGGANQKWQVNSAGTIVNPVSGLCLADPGNTTTLATQLQVRTCDASTGQDWDAESLTEAGVGVAELQLWYNTSTGLFNTTGWWQAAEALDVIIGYTEQTGDTSYEGDIANTFAKAAAGAPNSLGGDFEDQYYDDDGWWAMTWVDAYDLTGDSAYLTMAETIFTQMTKGWATTCGGGVYWNTSKATQNAAANELFLLLAARLYQRTQSQTYLTWAEKEWTWFQGSGMINSSSLVNDGISASTCKSNGATTWTYNQGVLIGGLATMYQITGSSSYLNQAEAIANAATTKLVNSSGILTEPCSGSGCNGAPIQFKGIFMRNLAYLNQVAPTPAYTSFIAAQAASVWASDQNVDNQFGFLWSGPFDSADASRQSSAVDALNAALAS